MTVLKNFVSFVAKKRSEPAAALRTCSPAFAVCDKKGGRGFRRARHPKKPPRRCLSE